MKPIIPFVSEASQDERREWRDALPEALADIAVVKPFETLMDEERRAARVAIVANPDPAQVAALPNLVWVQSLWAGVERLMTELPADGPLIVRLTDPQMAETMSEAVLAWTLYLHRDMPRYMAQQRQKIWHGHALKTPQEKTVGVLGIGKLGGVTAQRLQANGFKVMGWSRSPRTLQDVDCFSGPDGLETVLGRSDIVILLMPLTAETINMIGTAELALMKPGASIINFARGPILNEDALLKALDHGPLGHAVLDVFNEEPLPAEHPFWSHKKVTVLPHISAPTITSTASKIVAENIARFLADGTVPESVDRERGY